MNKRMPQQSQAYEKKRATESNNIPHSNLRFDSPSGYRWLSSDVASGSAVSTVEAAAGVSVGSGSVGTEVAVGDTVSVGGTSVLVSTGTTVSVRTTVPVGATVAVTPGDSIAVGCRVLVAVTAGSVVEVGVKLGNGVSTGEDWNNPEIAAESVRHNIATSTSDANNTSGLSLSNPRISCCIRRQISSLFIGRSIESFHNRLAKRRVLYQMCQAFANLNARTVFIYQKARCQAQTNAWCLAQSTVRRKGLAYTGPCDRQDPTRFAEWPRSAI